METQHILIIGERHVGKSTLIQKLLQHTTRPACGFITKRLTESENGFHPIYIHPADQAANSRSYTQENLIGTCDSITHNLNSYAFDVVGKGYLSNLPADGIVVMDELGFMEARTEVFTQRVLEVLDGDIPVLAAVKNRMDVPFLSAVCTHPKAAVFYITPENRDELFESLLPLIQNL